MSALTLITPDSDEFDKTITASGKTNPVDRPLLEVLTEATEAGLDTFQLPHDAEVDDGNGGTVALTVDSIRRWAYDRLPNMDGSPVPDGKRLSISGGKSGRNILVRIVDKDGRSKPKA